MDELDLPKSTSTITDVYIRAGFTKIYDIDTINQRFQAEFIVESKWKDANIKDLNEDLSKIAWKPELYIENSLNSIKEEISYKIVYDNEQKDVMISEIRKISGLFHENLELENFPLDIQDLSITIATKKNRAKINFILMQPELANVLINNTLDKSMWHIHNIVKTSKENLITEFSFGKREYPAVKLSCQVFRSPVYFYWNAVLPILLITFAALGPFVIDFKNTPSRLGTSASMLLTAVSLKAGVTRLLPTVSYLTSLDKYSIGSIMITTILLIYQAFLGAFGSIMGDFMAYSLDKLAFCAFFAIIVTQQIIYGVWLSNVHSYREKLKKNSLFHQDSSNDINKKFD